MSIFCSRMLIFPERQGCLLADTLDVLRTVLVHRKYRKYLLNAWNKPKTRPRNMARKISMNESWKLFISKITKELAMRKEECSYSCQDGAFLLSPKSFTQEEEFSSPYRIKTGLHSEQMRLWEARVFRLPAFLCTSAHPFPWPFNAPSSFIFGPNPVKPPKGLLLTCLFLSPQAELAGFLPVLVNFYLKLLVLQVFFPPESMAARVILPVLEPGQFWANQDSWSP